MNENHPDMLPNHDTITHILISGQSGAGKTTALEYITNLMYMKNRKYGKQKYKIIIFGVSNFLESVGFAIPPNIPEFVKNLKNLTVDDVPVYEKLKKSGFLNGFRLEIYHPLVKSKDLPVMLPKCVKLYTMSMKFFSNDNIIRILTNDSLSDGSTSKIVNFIGKMKKNETMTDIAPSIIKSSKMNFIEKDFGSEDVQGKTWFPSDTKKSIDSISRIFLKMMDYGIFSSQDFTYDNESIVMSDAKLKKILLDNMTITDFSCRWFNGDDKIKAALYSDLLMRIQKIAYDIPNLTVYIVVPEARIIFPSDTESEQRYRKILAKMATDFSKDARKANCHLILDTQIPSDVPSDLLQQCELRLIFRHNMKQKNLVDEFRGMELISNRNIKQIPQLPHYHFFISCPIGLIDRHMMHRINIFPYSVRYNFTGHLERGMNEMDILNNLYPDSNDWYQTRPVINKLFTEWSESSRKSKERVKKDISESQKRAVAEIIGKPKNYLIVLYTVRNLQQKNEGQPISQSILKKHLARKGIENYVSVGSINDSVKKLYEDGFIDVSTIKEGDATMTERGETFYQDNIEDLTELIGDEYFLN